MGNNTKREKIAAMNLYQMGYKYLCDNFHKFNDDKKIKIALEVYKTQHAKAIKIDNSNHTHYVRVERPSKDVQAQPEAGRVCFQQK